MLDCHAGGPYSIPDAASVMKVVVASSVGAVAGSEEGEGSIAKSAVVKVCLQVRKSR